MTARKPMSSMSREEIAWKRSNDRINQQYSRARKKRRLEDVERENKLLKEQLKETKEALELAKQREAAVQAAIQTAFTILNPSSDVLANKSHETSVDPMATIITSEQSRLHFQNNATQVDSEPYPLPPSVTQSVCHPYHELNTVFSGSDEGFILNLPIEFGQGAWVDLLDAPIIEQTHDQSCSVDFGMPTGMRIMERSFPLQPDDVGTSSQPPNRSNIELSMSSIPNPPSKIYPRIEQKAEATDLWFSLPVHLPPTTELDEVMTRITATGQQWASSQGRQHSELTKSSFPSVSSLLNPNTDDDKTDPIASAVAKFTLSTILQSFPRKVAFHYTVAQLLRWLVHPTEQSYRQLPEFLRPTVLQRTVPHPAWVDTVPWPESRNLIIQHMDFSQYDLFRSITGKCSSVNWPYPDADIFLAKGAKNQKVLNPVFISHIRRINNWTNGPELGKHFPFLSGWPTSPPSGTYHWP